VSEGRKHHRIACRCPVNFSTDELDGTGLVYNLAVGGCAVETEQSVGDHGYISLTITLVPGCPPVSIELAKLRWATRREFGVEFLTISGGDARRLEEFVRSHGPSSAGQ
jgi:hypothetical protein